MSTPPRRRNLEAQFQDGTVIPQLRVLGYLVYHTYDSRRSTAGFPDIIAVPPLHRPEWPVLAFEVKTDTGRLTAMQREWIVRLDGKVIAAREVRPETFADVVMELLGVERKREVA